MITLQFRTIPLLVTLLLSTSAVAELTAADLEKIQTIASQLAPPTLQGVDLVALQEAPLKMEVGKCWTFTKQNNKHKLIIQRVGETRVSRTEQHKKPQPVAEASCPCPLNIR